MIDLNEKLILQKKITRMQKEVKSDEFQLYGKMFWREEEKHLQQLTKFFFYFLKWRSGPR